MNVLQRIDKFGEPIPAFNLKGKNQIRTPFGGIMTITIIFFTLGYFLQKLNTILEKENPILNYIIN